VSTPFSFEYVFRVPSVSTLAAAYFDPDHNATQDKLANLGDRTVIRTTDRRASQDVVARDLAAPAPAIARPFVKGGRLSFLETMSWNHASNAIEMSVVPEVLGGRVSIAGAYELSQIGEGQVRRIYKGTITAAIALVGGKIERGILETFTENMPAMAACTQGWPTERSKPCSPGRRSKPSTPTRASSSCASAATASS
jgi:hypothetical protein